MVTTRNPGASRSRPPRPQRRLNVNVSEEAYQVLEALAVRKGKTISELLRDAIALERWLDEQEQEGGRLLVERGGQVREIVRT